MHSIIQKSWNKKEPLNSTQLQGCRRGNNTAPEVQGLISTASISTEKILTFDKSLCKYFQKHQQVWQAW